MITFEWTPIRYRNVISSLKNPFYAGAYAYGKSEKRTAIVDGRARKTYGHSQAVRAWEAISRIITTATLTGTEFERNQKQLAANAYRQKAVRSPDEVAEPCWPGFCSAGAAGGVCR